METRHERLYKTYAQDLRKAKTVAEKWWKDMVASAAAQTGSKKEAQALLEQRWTLGPAAHPRVLAVLRKYWLACEEINRQVLDGDDDDGNEESVSPIVFLCEFLLDGKNEKLAVFISPLNYWPIGTVEPHERRLQ